MRHGSVLIFDRSSDRRFDPVELILQPLLGEPEIAPRLHLLIGKRARRGGIRLLAIRPRPKLRMKDVRARHLQSLDRSTPAEVVLAGLLITNLLDSPQRHLSVGKTDDDHGQPVAP